MMGKQINALQITAIAYSQLVQYPGILWILAENAWERSRMQIHDLHVKQLVSYLNLL